MRIESKLFSAMTLSSARRVSALPSAVSRVEAMSFFLFGGWKSGRRGKRIAHRSGSARNRMRQPASAGLGPETVQDLPVALVASPGEILTFIERTGLQGSAIGYADVDLLASVALTPVAARVPRHPPIRPASGRVLRRHVASPAPLFAADPAQASVSRAGNAARRGWLVPRSAATPDDRRVAILLRCSFPVGRFLPNSHHDRNLRWNIRAATLAKCRGIS